MVRLAATITAHLQAAADVAAAVAARPVRIHCREQEQPGKAMRAERRRDLEIASGKDAIIGKPELIADKGGQKGYMVYLPLASGKNLVIEPGTFNMMMQYGLAESKVPPPNPIQRVYNTIMKTTPGSSLLNPQKVVPNTPK